MTPAAVEALDYVEWVGPSTYVTARGKEKDIVTGLPSAMFWRRWKRAGLGSVPSTLYFFGGKLFWSCAQ